METSDSPPSPQSQPLKPTIDEFLDSGNKSGNYRNTLDLVLSRWHERLADRGITSVDQITKRTLAAYARYLSQRVDAGKNRATEGGISAGTAWTYYDCVSAFLAYCVRWEYLSENPAQKGIALDEMPPRPSKKSGDQQFWTPESRAEIVRFADRRAHDAVDDRGLDAIDELRDRALVDVLAYSGVRGGEILSDPRDDRRDGLRWADVDIEHSLMTILGKNQQIEETQLPPQTHGPLERLEQALRPASDDWPVFPSSHAPSLYRRLPDDVDTEASSPLDLLREHDIAPPSLSTNGARDVMKRLCEAADIDIDGEYLKPHGGRRGVGEAIFRSRGAAAAQRALRHADPRTTSQQYAHIEASELAEDVGEVFDEE